MSDCRVNLALFTHGYLLNWMWFVNALWFCSIIIFIRKCHAASSWCSSCLIWVLLFIRLVQKVTVLSSTVPYLQSDHCLHSLKISDISLTVPVLENAWIVNFSSMLSARDLSRNVQYCVQNWFGPRNEVNIFPRQEIFSNIPLIFGHFSDISPTFVQNSLCFHFFLSFCRQVVALCWSNVHMLCTHCDDDYQLMFSSVTSTIMCQFHTHLAIAYPANDQFLINDQHIIAEISLLVSRFICIIVSGVFISRSCRHSLRCCIKNRECWLDEKCLDVYFHCSCRRRSHPAAGRDLKIKLLCAVDTPTELMSTLTASTLDSAMVLDV